MTVIETMQAQHAAMLSGEDGAEGQGAQGGERLEVRSRQRAKERKQRMRNRCERLEAVLLWTLISLDYDMEKALRTAKDWVRNALPIAQMIGELVGWDYERMALKET